MMAVVALLAVSLWTGTEIRDWRERQEYCRYQASAHDERAQYALAIAAHVERGRPVFYQAQYAEVSEYFYDCADQPKVDDPVKIVSPVDRRREAADHLASQVPLRKWPTCLRGLPRIPGRVRRLRRLALGPQLRLSIEELTCPNEKFASIKDGDWVRVFGVLRPESRVEWEPTKSDELLSLGEMIISDITEVVAIPE
jgi:hypothetical protein